MTNDHELAERWQAAIRSHGTETAPSDDGWTAIQQQRKNDPMTSPTNPNRTPARLVLAAAAIVAVVGIGIAVFTSSDKGQEVRVAHEGPGFVPAEGGAPAGSATTEPSSVPVTKPPTDNLDGGPKPEPGSNPSPTERVEIGGLPEGSAQIQTAPSTSLNGSKVLSTLYQLPGTNQGGRDLSVRATTVQNERATETFEALRAKGVDPAFGQRLQETTVRGGLPAVTVSAKAGEDDIVIVKWLERPDLQVELVGYNISLDEARRFAEGVAAG